MTLLTAINILLLVIWVPIMVALIISTQKSRHRAAAQLIEANALTAEAAKIRSEAELNYGSTILNYETIISNYEEAIKHHKRADEINQRVIARYESQSRVN